MTTAFSRPGKDHRHPRVALPFYGDVALGNGTMWKIGAFMTATGRLFVGVERHGSYTFQHWVHIAYASEKLEIGFIGDAGCMADWVNDQLGHADPDGNRQGVYQDEFVGEDRL
jgi:hypothetical protein